MTRLKDFSHPEHMHAAYVGTLVANSSVGWSRQVDRSRWPKPEEVSEVSHWGIWMQAEPMGVFRTYAFAYEAGMQDPPNSYAVTCIEHFLTEVAKARLRPARVKNANVFFTRESVRRALGVAFDQQSAQFFYEALHKNSGAQRDIVIYDDLALADKFPRAPSPGGGSVANAVQQLIQSLKEPDHVPFRASNAHHSLCVVLDRHAQRRQRGG